MGGPLNLSPGLLNQLKRQPVQVQLKPVEVAVPAMPLMLEIAARFMTTFLSNPLSHAKLYKDMADDSLLAAEVLIDDFNNWCEAKRKVQELGAPSATKPDGPVQAV